MRILTLAALLLTGCYEGADTGGCVYLSAWSGWTLRSPKEHDSMAWKHDLRPRRLEGLSIDFIVANLSEEKDCIVALYASGDAPDPSALPRLDPGSNPPAPIEGLGELVQAINLARSTDDLTDRQGLHAGGSPPADVMYYTLVACEDSQIEVEWETMGEACGDEASEADGHIPLERLW